MKAKLLPEADLSVLEKQTLRRQLDEYYAKVADYMAFSDVSNQTNCWIHIENELRRLTKPAGERINVLEVGAGRSGFGEWLKTRGLRDAVNWSVQDVTRQNAPWLESQADQVFYGDVGVISTKPAFDIVFSTYVLEHITDPDTHLNHLYDLLQLGGLLFIFCPRYDAPGYLCPSSRHLSWSVRLNFEANRLVARSRSLFSHHPAFLIQTDLAAFHGPYFIDADAVHWVSFIDLIYWAHNKGAGIKKLRDDTARMGIKDWIVKRWLTCSVVIYKGKTEN